VLEENLMSRPILAAVAILLALLASCSDDQKPAPAEKQVDGGWPFVQKPPPRDWSDRPKDFDPPVRHEVDPDDRHLLMKKVVDQEVANLRARIKALTNQKGIEALKAQLGILEDVAGYAVRGTIWALQVGDWQWAILDLDAALKLSPKDSWALYCRGVAHKAQGHMDLAKKDFAGAVEIDPVLAWITPSGGPCLAAPRSVFLFASRDLSHNNGLRSCAQLECLAATTRSARICP
jgi:hypothetical protein